MSGGVAKSGGNLRLISGGLMLRGQPTATAEPVPERLVAIAEMLATYSDWLFYERHVLMAEMSGYVISEARRLGAFVGDRSDDFHFFPADGDWRTIPQPSSRAALVLSAVGCDWTAQI